MSKGTRITTLRIQPATLVEVDGAIDSAADSPWPRQYVRASWIRQAIREKLGHLRRSREYRERRRHQVEDVRPSPATAASFTKGASMVGLVVSRAGRLDALTVLVSSWPGRLFAGLYQGELAATDETDIDWIQPADFTGYTGLQPVGAWTVTGLVGELAVATAAPITWRQTGGAKTQWVNGYYVVDTGGVLQWVEEFEDGPAPMVGAGKICRVIPRFGQGSRFPVQE